MRDALPRGFSLPLPPCGAGGGGTPGEGLSAVEQPYLFPPPAAPVKPPYVPAFDPGPAPPHKFSRGCLCERCKRRAMRVFVPDITPAVIARARMAARASAWHTSLPTCLCGACASRRASAPPTGLSNPSYLAVPFQSVDSSLLAALPDSLAAALPARRGIDNSLIASPSGEIDFQVIAGSSRVSFRLSDAVNKHSMVPLPPPAKRGVVRELSEPARDRLKDRAWSLLDEGYIPQAMFTLTSPANWEAVYLADVETGEVLEGGRVFKRHIAAFRKRLNRFLAQAGIYHWSALWWLEFQARGAPHLHLIIFDCEMSRELIIRSRRWVGRAWSQIVGNPDKEEGKKHSRAGTQVARMRTKHFGYASKYASKMEQKEVPEEFKGVGRFWGVWNYKAVPPVVIDFKLDCSTDGDLTMFWEVITSALATVDSHSSSFPSRTLARLDRIISPTGIKRRFSFTVYGSDAVRTTKEAI